MIDVFFDLSLFFIIFNKIKLIFSLLYGGSIKIIDGSTSNFLSKTLIAFPKNISLEEISTSEKKSFELKFTKVFSDTVLGT